MMTRRSFPALKLSATSLGALVGVLFFAGAPAHAAGPGNAARGAVIFAAGDCVGCHTDAKAKTAPLSGGAPMPTDFGVFYAPNITSDKGHGLGSWTEAEFKRAMREGKGKDGEFLYPVFPYPAFSGMSDQDISDLWAYMKTIPASNRASKAHETKFPFGMRPLLLGWRVMFFHKGPLEPVAGKSAEWNRGRYLAEAVAHCGECHSPRNALGGIDDKNAYAGNPKGPDNQNAPNITPHKDGIPSWGVAEIEEILNSGGKPDGDYVGGGMGLVVEGTAKLSAADRKAIAVYIKSLPPKASPPKPAAKKG